MQPKELRFTLTTSTGATVLQYAPDGWDDSLVKWGRSDKYYGLFRSFTIPLRFVKDGKDILREQYYGGGVESLVSLKIERLKSTDWTYETWYDAEVDFSTYKETDDFVEINVIEGGIAKLLKSNEAKEYAVYFDQYTPGFQQWGIATMNREAVTLRGVFNLLADLILNGGVTAGTYLLKSDFLDTLTADCLTTGRNIRGILAPIKTSFNDFYDSLNAVYCIGCGVEIDPATGKQTLVIEQRSHFYDDATEILSIGNVSNFMITPSDELMFNKLKLGYEKQSYETEEFAFFEPNITNEYSVPLNRIARSTDYVSKYRSDYWGIQDIYNQLDNDVDNSQGIDDDIFFINIHDTGGANFLLEPGTVTKPGVSFQYWYNLKFSPFRCLLNHESWLQSLCYPLESLGYSNVAEFMKSDIDNENNQTLHDGTTYDEYDDLPIDSTDIIFQPVNFEFDSPSDINMMETMETDMKGYVSFTHKDISLSGFVVEVTANPYKSKVLHFKLLATPQCDLTDLLNQTGEGS